MANISFAKDKLIDPNQKENQQYKILIVDDDKAIHDITNFVLKDMDFFDFKIHILTAYSAEEAQNILLENHDIALALIDVVMETQEAGLELVNYIRNDLKNEIIRLVIRTGQANNFPQMQVIKEFDINDFKEKTELTVEKLFVTIRSSIKQYEYILKLKQINQNLDKKIKEEIEKNRKKDHIMLQQNRLANMCEMISMIAHQWRQPLSTISIVASSLETKLQLGLFDLKNQEGIDEAQKYFINKIGSISSYVQNLSQTIDDFRNFYIPNKKLVKTTYEEVVAKSLKIIEASIQNDNIEIIQEYNNSIEIEVLDRELMQVIMNLLKNSQDNFREKDISEKKIYIKASSKELKMSDNGGGIKEDIIDKVFDPYFSTKNEKNGTGLGLYMSKIIVEEHHNGKLTVENVNNGTCFIIALQ